MKKLSAQRGIIHIPILLIILAVAGAAIWFFLNKGELGTSGMKVPIPPSQLMPFVSGKETRTTICNLKKEELFVQSCQSKFDAVGKEDVEKIAELFALIEKIKNDKNISDYDRLLLAQVIFAALPTKDSPETNLYQPSPLSRLKDYLTGHNIVYAEEKTMSEEEFRKLMEQDLKNVVDSLPKRDNAWIIQIMVSKYSWVDGKRQPLYADQYFESYDPFPNNPNVQMKDIYYHVRSIIGSAAWGQTGQTVDIRGSVKGTSEMFTYSFAVLSWNSKEYTGKDGPVEEKFLTDRRDFSDANYWGEHYLTDLLDSVKMPPTKRLTESPDKGKSKSDAQTNTQGKLPVLAKQPWDIKINCSKISTTLHFKDAGDPKGAKFCKTQEDQIAVSNTLVLLNGYVYTDLAEDLADPNKPHTADVKPDKTEDLSIGDVGNIFYWGPPWGEGPNPAIEYRAKLGLCDMVVYGSAIEDIETYGVFGYKGDWQAAADYMVKKLSSAAKEIAANIAEECGAKK